MAAAADPQPADPPPPPDATPDDLWPRKAFGHVELLGIDDRSPPQLALEGREHSVDMSVVPMKREDVCILLTGYCLWQLKPRTRGTGCSLYGLVRRRHLPRVGTYVGSK